VDLNQNSSTAVADSSGPLNLTTMGRASSNRTSNSLLNLALAAFYLNLTIKSVSGNFFEKFWEKFDDIVQRFAKKI
ncbi:unnamed protein product, partial [Nesidiocoris tenuis]